VDAFREHLEHPVGKGLIDGHRGVAGGALCGDYVSIAVRVRGDRVTGVGWEAAGCGATFAACSAVALLADGGLLDAGRVSVAMVSDELGGLSPGKLHAAELACDAFHSALGAAVRETAVLDEDPGRVAVAMSGGVDSAVAALLVGEGGFGVTVELWRDPDNDAEASCCSASAVRAARAVAHGLGMAHFTLDLREEFRAGVVDPWLADHAAGLTPNPCVRCNGRVRLDAMLAFAERLGAPTLATGHYARVHDGRLRAAADPAKDQAYMLAATAPETLERLRFPLGERTKGEVRALAADAGLPVASKAESQDLCFLAGTGRAAFLAKHGAPDEPGDLVRDGEAIGRHDGQQGFTVGQRRGLRIASEEPLYVLRKTGSTVVVGSRDQLAVSEVRVRDAVVRGEADAVRLRYRSPAIRCEVRGEAPSLTLALSEPFHGAAPGQVAVLYSGDTVVGHGTIAE
jgi:tRNA-uridine 2-sulfurtransferase